MELGGNVGFNSSFYVLNFPRNKSVVFLENKESSVYIEDDRMIDLFRNHAAKLGNAALDPAASIARVGVGRPLARCRRAALFQRPPTRTRRASFPAPGSPVTTP
jgi:hypothetical protein